MLKARLHCHDGRYSVLFDGKLLLEGSRDPECDAARALLARGYTGTLHMLDGKTRHSPHHHRHREGAKSNGGGRSVRSAICEAPNRIRSSVQARKR
jgi:hypothetical protein